jgi:hypothetical protein
MKFKAFISYKHVKSTGFAERLELALKAYAKPLYRPPMAIFRDEKHLRAGGDLPGLIRSALEASEFLVFLASPEAAASAWVRDELAYWCTDADRRRRLIIVLTGGTIATDPATKRIDWARTDALPPTLADTLVSVPLYVDLSWAQRDEQQTLLNPEYKKAVNRIVATLRHVDPIELSGEEVLQHRRNLRIRRALVGSLGALTMMLAAATWLAWTQKREADLRAREATSRRLAAEADRIADERIDRALLLMAQAYRMADTTALRASWWRLLGRPDLAQVYLPMRGSDVRFEEDGSLTVTTEHGAVSFAADAAHVWTRRDAPGRGRDANGPAEWEWAGGCERQECDETAVWQCARDERRIIGPYGDSDFLCVRSALRVPSWCGDATLDLPGYEIRARRSGRWVHVTSNLGSASFLCVNERGAVPRHARLVSGDRVFFATSGLGAFDSGGSPVTRLSVSHDDQRIALRRSDGTVEIRAQVLGGDTPPRPGVTRLEPDRIARAIAASPTGAIALAVDRPGASGGDVILWRSVDDALQGREPHRRIAGLWQQQPSARRADAVLEKFGLPASYGVLALSDDGERLVAGASAELSIVSTDTGQRLPDRPYLGRRGALLARFSRSNGLAVVARPLDGAINSGGQLFGEGLFSREFGEQVQSMAFLPGDPERVLTAGGRGVQAWSVRTGELLQTITDAPADGVAIDPGTGRLAISLTAGSDTLPATQLELRSPSGSQPITSGRQTGRTLAVALPSSEPVVLWASNAGLQTWHWETDSWTALDTVPHLDVRSLGTGRVLALRLTQAVVYDLRPSRWFELTCAIVQRNLTPQEWAAHIGESFPYEETCAQAATR